MTDDAPCGCRGVVAASEITASSCQALWAQHSIPPEGPNGVAPLIAVPERLCMTSEDAHELLSQVLSSAADPATAVTTKHLSGRTHTAPPTNSTTRPASLLEQAASSFGLLLGLPAASGGHQRGVLQQRLRQLQPPMLLALLLAQQRRLGPQSFWHAYISSLPERPPCAWFDAVEQQLLRPATSTQESKQEQQWFASMAGSAGAAAAALDASTLAAAASAVAAKCRAAADVFGAALGGVSAAEIAWAYGQVVSRAFATGPPGTAGIALLPVIDMLNHTAGAAVPVCWLGEAEEGAQQQKQEQHQQDGAAADIGGDGGLWCVWRQQLSSEQDADLSTDSAAAAAAGGAGDGGSGGGVAGVESKGDPVVLCAGQELYISYMSSCDAASAYLSFGFMPPEIQLEG